jgi:predicted  nucleic acid-binding Zn-ribbon protein
MSTTQLAAQLFQLQQIDLELDRLASEQQAIQTVLQSNTRLRKLRSEYEAAQQQLQASLQTQQEAEWTLDDLNRRLKTQEQRLYNGSVVNAKELQSLQQEVQRLRAQQSRQEDLTLEAIDMADSLRELVRQKEAAFQEAEAAWQQECSTLLVQHDQLEKRRQDAQTKRAQMVVSVDADILARYDKMRHSKQGRAISKVEQNSCQWCRVILTPSELQRVRISAELQTCTNCGRILYYDR